MDLDIQLLQDGVDGFIKSLKKLPKDVQALPVKFFLENRMKEFKQSLPLLLDLKNEALRERSVNRRAAELNLTIHADQNMNIHDQYEKIKGNPLNKICKYMVF